MTLCTRANITLTPRMRPALPAVIPPCLRRSQLYCLRSARLKSPSPQAKQAASKRPHRSLLLARHCQPSPQFIAFAAMALGRCAQTKHGLRASIFPAALKTRGFSTITLAGAPPWRPSSVLDEYAHMSPHTFSTLH